MRLKSENSVGTASRVTKLLLYFLAGVAAMGVGTTAQQPRVVRVDSGELQGVLDDGRGISQRRSKAEGKGNP